MKSLKSLILLTLLLVALSYSGSAQVRVTGHIGAEVVESASAQNHMNGHVRVNPTDRNNIDLGNINISGTSNATFDVSVASTNLYNEAGSYKLATEVTNNLDGLISDHNGKQSLSLSALIDNETMNGEYKSNITVIVSYN